MCMIVRSPNNSTVSRVNAYVTACSIHAQPVHFLAVFTFIITRIQISKCEIIADDDSVVANIKTVLPSVRHVPCCEAVLLGAPVGDEISVETVIHSKLVEFRRHTGRLNTLNAHDVVFALILLTNCFGLPKLMYTLRCAACYKSTVLRELDGVSQLTLKTILNVDLANDVWTQASLPVSGVGLGVHLATDLALPAVLSSVNGAASFTLKLLSSRHHAVSCDRDPACVAAGLEY
jgi:hypothetical protein